MPWPTLNLPSQQLHIKWGYFTTLNAPSNFPGVTVDATSYKNSTTDKENLGLTWVSMLLFLEQN